MNAPATNIAIAETKPRSVLIDMSMRFGMEPAAFESTVRATCLRPEKDGTVPTREEFAAFLMAAREYNLNPLLREIYGFRAKSGAIVPVVGVDGWSNIINSHPAFDGIEFDDHFSADGKELTAITARIWRKDRSKPTVVTEYLSECRRQTDTWRQWPRRLLRHKAMIQCARYAFGFAGVFDPDEAERMGVDLSPMRTARSSSDDGPPPPRFTPPQDGGLDLVPGETMDAESGEVTWGDPPPPKPQEQPADPLEIPECLRRNKTTPVAAEPIEPSAEFDSPEHPEPSTPLEKGDAALAAAAEHGRAALEACWNALPRDVRMTLKTALERRHKPRAESVDKAKETAS